MFPEKYFPGLSQHMLSLDISTPITYLRYTLNHHGASMGWKGFGFWKQRVPFVKGLYRAGHWVGPMGVHTAIYTGKNAAELVLRDDKGFCFGIDKLTGSKTSTGSTPQRN